MTYTADRLYTNFVGLYASDRCLTVRQVTGTARALGQQQRHVARLGSDVVAVNGRHRRGEKETVQPSQFCGRGTTARADHSTVREVISCLRIKWCLIVCLVELGQEKNRLGSIRSNCTHLGRLVEGSENGSQYGHGEGSRL